MTFWQQIDRLLLRTAAKSADRIRTAIKASIDIDQVIQDWQHAHPDQTTITRAQARDWAKIHIHPKTAEIRDELTQIYAIGWTLGTDVGRAALAHAFLSKASDPNNLIDYLNTDWTTWKPGNHPAEYLVRPPGALADLIRSRGFKMSQDLTATTLDRIGTKLADALALGSSSADLGDYLSDVISDPMRALTIATTEMNASMSAASLNTYDEYGVAQKEWLSLDACDLCSANDDQGAIPLDEEFESGDMAPPGHPNCRCSILPVVDGVEMSDQIVDANLEMMVKGVLTAGDVDRALQRLQILPNPNDPSIENITKYVLSPWQVVPVPTIDPKIWDKAELELIELADLYGTDPFLRRKNVAKHIETLGQANSEYRSYAMVIQRAGKSIIIDGHHRLMALWLLGLDKAPVWIVKE